MRHISNEKSPSIPFLVRVGLNACCRINMRQRMEGAGRWGGKMKAAAALGVLAIGASFVFSIAGTAPLIPAIDLSLLPLMAVSQGDKPVMALALSVEFPTVGAQYVPPAVDASGPPLVDDTYSNATEYIGYYDAESCYAYNNAPAETPASGQTAQDYKRFDRSGPATNRMCADGFSGNFLNFASSSAVDMMRMALSGGDRYIDSPALTVLQRAVLPDGQDSAVSCFFNSKNFPAKRLLKNGGNYFGAIPQAMIQKTASKDVWVGNMLDRIYFGALDPNPSNDASLPTAPNWCGGSASYKLGAGQPSPSTADGQGPPVMQPVPTSLPANATSWCAENATCTLPWNATSQQVYEVWFGSGNRWSVTVVKNWSPCTTAVLGDPSPSASKSCHIRIPSNGTAAWPPPGVPGLNSEGYFFARVQVCASNADGTLADNRDYGLCTKYPNGKYKPTGAIQKYANDLRLATFGYLLDQQAPSYNPQGSFGGVLRAPMKYVGEKTYNEAGIEVSGTNPNREWDLQTGIFYANPDGHSMGISGVVNYLNKFGRTGAVPGRYKKFDPVSELHYEVLRYLQGRPAPTPLAVSRINTELRDGFPVYTSWTDPYGNRSSTGDYSCQKTSIVTVGDIRTNDPSPDRIPAGDAANAVPDLLAWNGWRGVAQGFELNNDMAYTDSRGVAHTANRAVDTANPINTKMSYSPLVGSAYWARSQDIRPATWSDSSKRRPGMRVRSFFFDVNEWGESAGSTKTTFRRTENKFFTAAKYGGYETDPLSDSSNSWGNPFKRQNGSDDHNVWQKPDEPGEAKTYYLAENSRRVLRAFDDIFKQASIAARSIAGSAISNNELTTAGSNAYQGAFNTEDWSGDVLSLPVTVTAGTVAVGATPTWQAGARLTAMTDPVGTRNIIVGRAGATSSPVGTPFTWATIDQPLKDQLAKASPSAAPDALGPERLKFLRGDRSREGTDFRKRGKLLGDVVNSGATFLGAPSVALSSETDYTDFYNTHASRPATVFAGANDGMLHAFSAANGDEVFAYIPSWLGSKLSALADPKYSKQAYVDATAVVGEALTYDKTSGTSRWKSVLISGTGGGGRGLFALDVTRAADFNKDKVLWEFTQADDADMGFVIGKPQIVKMRTSAPNAPPVYQWFAMVASGINNYIPDASGIFSATGKPALFLLSLEKPVGDAWVLADALHEGNYHKISLPIASAASATGLLNFRPIYGSARQVTAVYAGDLHGNLWKLDFARRAKADWTMEKLSAFYTGTEAVPVPVPMYIARAANGDRQPISMAPSVSAGSQVQGVQTAYVAFGTGKFLEPGDKTSIDKNSFYVVYDPGKNELDNSSGNSAISGRTRLQSGTVNVSTGTVAFAGFTWGMPLLDTDTAKRAGFYFDFLENGERQVSNAIIKGNQLVFGSLNPTAAGSTEPCKPGRGGNEYSLNVDTGNGGVKPSTVGLLGEPLVVDLSGLTTYTKSDTTGRRTKTTVSQILQQGSGGVGPGDKVTTTVIAGRLSWRQVSNYQDVRSAP
jgi:type IV pilus assembly protein PilY1